MRLLFTTFVVVAFLCALCAEGLVCRSGINTTILGFPLQFWDESDQCSTSSSQSCFIGEISYDVNFQENDLTLVYGSCISTAYKSLLECDKVFSSSSGLRVNLLKAFIPELEKRLTSGIETLSTDAAKSIKNFLKNENGELDNLKVIEVILGSIMKSRNLTVPSNVTPIVTKLDTLLLTAIANTSQLEEAAGDLLLSFKKLDTRDEAASRLLYGFFDRNNLTVTDNFRPLIDNLPGFISRYIKHENSFQEFNSSVFTALSLVNSNNITATLSNVMKLVGELLSNNSNIGFNFEPILNTVVKMVDQMIKGTAISDLTLWQMDLLRSYSNITDASTAFSNSTLSFLKRFLPLEILSPQWVTLITHLPGYLHYLSDDKSQLEAAFYTFSKVLDSYDPSITPDLNEILQSHSINTSALGLTQNLAALSTILNLVASRNLTEFGTLALQSLQDSSKLTNESVAMSNSFIDFFGRLNITLHPEHRRIITNAPGMLLVSLPQYTDLINMIFMNISQSIGGIDVTKPNFDALFNTLAQLIPSEYKLRKFIVSLSSLLDQLLARNFEYITKWQLDLLVSYSKVNEATQTFSNATFEFLRRAGAYGNITEELKTFITHSSGYFYTFFPAEMSSQLEAALYNISELLKITDPRATIDIDAVLKSYSLNTSDPGLQNIISAVNNILNLAHAKSANEFGLEALESLKKMSNRSNATLSLSTSFLSLLESLNITVPEEYKRVAENAPGLVIALFPGNEDFLSSLFTNISLYINNINVADQNYEVVFKMLSEMIPVDYNLRLFVRSLAPLLTQLGKRNFGYVNQWQMDLLKAYSTVTNASESVSNSIFMLLRRVGLYNYLPQEAITVIAYSPAYISNFFPESMKPQLELALYNISEILKITHARQKLDIGSVLKSFSLNTSDPALQSLITALNSVVNIAKANNLTELGKEALLSLKNLSVVTNESSALVGSFKTFLGLFNITIPVEYEDFVQNVPGLLVTLLPEQQGYINILFRNISQYMNNSNINGTNYREIFDLVKSSVPVEYNLHPLIDSLPSLLGELTKTNFGYFNVWQINLLKSYSRNTNATIAFANSTLEFLIRNGIYDNIPDEIKEFVINYPRYLYNFVPTTNLTQFELALKTISDALKITAPGSTIDVEGIMSSFSLNTSDPRMEGVILAISSITNIASSKNLTELGIRALNSLKISSIRTNESEALISSFVIFLEKFNITIPAEYREVVQNAPGLFITVLPEYKHIINAIFLNVSDNIKNLDIHNPNYEALLGMLSAVIPAELNLKKFINCLPKLLRELAQGNFTYIYHWEINLLQAYSRVTTATKSLSNSTLDLLQRFGILDSLTPELNTLIQYYPGSFYPFFSTEMIPQLELAFVNIAHVLKIMDRNTTVNITEILQSYSLNTSDPGLQAVITGLNSILNIARAQNETEFAMEALASLRTISVTTNETSALSDSFQAFLRQLNITIPGEYESMTRNLPGLLFALLPESRDAISLVFANISQHLDLIDINKPDFHAIINRIKVMIPAEAQDLTFKFLDSLPSLFSQIKGGNESYINTWQLNLLVQYSRITPATELLSNCTFELLKRHSLYDQSPEYIKILLIYYPGYFYNFIPADKIPQFELALVSACEIVKITDPDSNTKLANILHSLSLNTSSPGIAEIIHLFDSIANITTSRNLTEFGSEALKSLESVAKVSQESNAMIASLFRFLRQTNTTIPEEYQRVLSQAPGLLLSFLPEQSDLLNSVFMNISVGLNRTDITTMNFTYLYVTLLDNLKNLIPAEYNQQKLLESLPALINQLMIGNLGYINTWQLELLKAYSTITPATEAISNSTMKFLARIEMDANVTEQLKKFITYYPGYFYSIVGNDSAMLDMILYRVATALDSYDPSVGVDVGALFESLSINATALGLQKLVTALDGIANIAMARNLTHFGKESLKSLKHFATPTNATTTLSHSMVRYLSQFNITMAAEYLDLINYVPALIAASLPEHKDVINAVFLSAASNFDAINISTPNFQQILRVSISPIMMLNVSDEVKGYLQQGIESLNLSDPKGSVAQFVSVLKSVIPNEMNQTAVVLNTLPNLLQQILAGNYSYLNNWSIEIMKAFSLSTPSTERLSNSTLELMRRFGIYGNLPDHVKSLIQQQPAYINYVYSLSNSSMTMDAIFDTISTFIDSIDQTKPVNMSGLLSLVLPSEFKFDGMDQINSLVGQFVQVALSGNTSSVGIFALDALRNSSALTVESIRLSNAITSIFDNVGVSIPEEWKNVLHLFPGIFIAGNPDKSHLLNSIFGNVSQGLESFGNHSSNYSGAVASALTALYSLNVTFENNVGILLIEFPQKINASNPVTSMKAAVELVTSIIPKEYESVSPLINSVPDLINRLNSGDANALNSWVLELMKSTNESTTATQVFSNSVTKAILDLGLESVLDDNVKAFIGHQPGYLYRYFPNRKEQIDTILYSTSLILHIINPSLDGLQGIVKVMISEGVNSTISGPLQTLMSKMSFGDTNSTNNVILTILAASDASSQSDKLGQAIIEVFENANITVSGRTESTIKSVPAIFVLLYPNQTTLINKIYERITNGIRNSLNKTFDVEEVFDDVFAQLQAAKVPIPVEIIRLSDYMQDLLNAVISQQPFDAMDWLVKILPIAVSSNSTNSSSAFSDALKDLFYKTGNITSDKRIDVVIEYIPRILYQAFPNNHRVIDVIYQNVTTGLQLFDFTKFNLSGLATALGSVPVAIPAKVQYLLSDFGGLLNALIRNNQSAINEWGVYMYGRHCSSNRTVSKDFTSTMVHILRRYSVPLPENMSSVIECIPETLYNFMPNQTELLDNVLRQFVQANTNFSAFINTLLASVDVELPSNIQAGLGMLPDIQTALFTGNISEFTSLLQDVQSAVGTETHLSTMVISLLSQFGIYDTYGVKAIVQQSTSWIYNPSLLRLYPPLETFLASMNASLATGNDVGTALVNAFAKVNVSISARYLPLLKNLQPIVNAIASNNSSAISKAILNTLIAYNTSFPSYQVQYAISQYKLQVILENHAVSGNIPDEAFEHLSEMYRLLLKMSNVSEDIVKSVLVETYPEAEAYINALFQVQPKISIRFIYNFTAWLFNRERNITVLAAHIKSLVDIVMSEQDLQLANLLGTLTAPKSCQYETCSKDMCNTYADLLLNRTEIKTTTATTDTTAPTNAATTKMTTPITTAPTETTAPTIVVDSTTTARKEMTTTAVSRTTQETTTSSTQETDTKTTTLATGTTNSVTGTSSYASTISTTVPQTTTQTASKSTTDTTTIAETTTMLPTTTTTNQSTSTTATSPNTTTTAITSTTSGNTLNSMNSSHLNMMIMSIIVSLKYFLS